MRSLPALLAILLLIGCQDTEQPETDSAPPTSAARSISSDVPDDAVARYVGGTVSAADVDAYILSTPAADRPAPGADLDAWYRERIRLLVMERLLLEQAHASGLDEDAEHRLRRIAVERQLAIGQCLIEENPDLFQIDADAIAAAHAERIDALSAPERRSVLHIYRRQSPGTDLDALEAELTTVRDRILAGERFQKLAQDVSDSESRHRSGSLGWFIQGQLPAAFDEVIFALDEGVPSRPLRTSDGVHLFQVDDALPERELSLNEAAPQLRAQLQAEREAAALDVLAARNESPAVRIVDRETLEQLSRDGDGDSVVLETEQYSLTLDAFRQRLGRVFGDQAQRSAGIGTTVPAQLAWEALDRLRRHEAAYETCRTAGWIDDETLLPRLQAWADRALIARMRQQTLREHVLDDPVALERFYTSNQGPFLPPVQWNLDRLQVPFNDVASAEARMGRLETLAAANTKSLAEIRDELGGELAELGWVTMQDMQRMNPKLAQRVAALPVDSLVAPLRIDNRLEIYRVTGRRDPQPGALDDVRDAVASAYLRQYTAEIYAEIEAQWLDQASFEVFESRLELLRQPGLPNDPISVEALDELLTSP